MCIKYLNLSKELKVFKTLNLDSNSFIKSINNKKYFSNIFIINGIEGGLIFSHAEKNAIIEKIEKRIFSSKNVTKIDVVASITRPEKTKSGFYTVYVVEIELGDYK